MKLSIKKHCIYIFILLFTFNLYAKEEKNNNSINKWLYVKDVKINKPYIIDSTNIKQEKFSDKYMLNQKYLKIADINPALNDTFYFDNDVRLWTEIDATKKGIIKSKLIADTPSISYFVAYISSDRFVPASIKVKSNKLMLVYLDDKEIIKISNLPKAKKGKKSKKAKKADGSSKIKLDNKLHKIVIKILNTDKTEIDFNFIVDVEKKYSKSIVFTTSNKREMEINDIFSGKRLNSSMLSPSGNLAIVSYSEYIDNGKRRSWKVIRNLLNDYQFSFQPMPKSYSYQWGKDDYSIFFLTKEDKKTNIWKYDFRTGESKLIKNKIEDFASYYLSPDNTYLIYTISQKVKEKQGVMDRIEGMEDRQEAFKKRTTIYYLDLKTEISEQLTYSYHSTYLSDISADGKNILFQTTRPDYTENPFSKETLYMMDIETRKVRTIWKDIKHGLSVQFSPDGTKLLCIGGADAFDGLGRNIPDSVLANNYDRQAYIYNINTRKARPISIDFKPTIGSAYWSIHDNLIYISAREGQYKTIYRYNPVIKKYSKYSIKEDIVSGVSYSKTSSGVTFIGLSGQSPAKLYKMNLETKEYSIVDNPTAKQYENVEFGKIEKWDFVKNDGGTIKGRIHFPVGFDSTKKYPVIVYYYAGTSPVTYSFGGRYPFNIYNSNGYIVYCLQPSGAVGYGQEFSARHVNNWGEISGAEIIEGTEKFIKAHNYVDTKKIGCIGASYGGFSTMDVITKSDIFSAAISHAGISSVSSYWGEGYWGYSYSAEASKHSYPWNNQKLYIKNSPLFNADKVNTPILLLHGDSDTNVPRGESIQFYTALKILGKETELIFIKDTDHWVIAYEQRVKWHKTIMAWFDKYLKSQDEYWKDLYPDKKY